MSAIKLPLCTPKIQILLAEIDETTVDYRIADEHGHQFGYCKYKMVVRRAKAVVLFNDDSHPEDGQKQTLVHNVSLDLTGTSEAETYIQVAQRVAIDAH